MNNSPLPKQSKLLIPLNCIPDDYGITHGVLRLNPGLLEEMSKISLWEWERLRESKYDTDYNHRICPAIQSAFFPVDLPESVHPEEEITEWTIGLLRGGVTLRSKAKVISMGSVGVRFYRNEFLAIVGYPAQDLGYFESVHISKEMLFTLVRNEIPKGVVWFGQGGA